MPTRVVSLLAGLAVAAVCAAPAAAQIPPPQSDPFYTAPGPIAGVPAGTVLRSRPIEINVAGIPLGLFSGWQLLYTTRDTHDAPEATVATIIVPKAAPPAGGRTLVAYTPAEDALTQDCAPSYEIRKGTHAEEIAQLLPLLRGSAVVVPDYEGPDSQWTAGVQAGHATLDAIRAAESFAPAGLDGAKTPVGIWGYSGGGQAAAWTGELQPGYAPELNVRGIAFGGAPAYVEETIRNLDGGPFAGILFGAVVGLSRAYPELNLQSFLNAKGKAMVDDVGKGCISDWIAPYALHKLSEYTTVPDPFNLPIAKKIIAAVSLGQHKPGAPVHIYHSVLDELNPVSEADRLVATYCRQGVAVDYDRSLLGEHIVVVATGAPAAAEFLADRFAGKPAPNTCGATRQPRETAPASPASSRSCTRRRAVRITIRRPRGARVRRVSVYLDGRRVRTLKGARTRVAVGLAGHAGKTVRVKLVVRVTRGARAMTLRQTRTYRTCA